MPRSLKPQGGKAVSDSAVLVEPTPDVEAAPILARPGRRPIAVMKQRRFRGNLRFNALRYFVLSSSLLLSWGLLRASMWKGTGTPESTFLLALAGGLLAA